MTAAEENVKKDEETQDSQEKEDQPAYELTAGRTTAFSSVAAFEAAQRMANCLASSDLVPEAYRKNLPNSIIALEMSQRLGMNPLMVMQNLYIVYNRPAWSSQFLIACINGCGRFSPLRYDVTGEGDGKTCVAWAYDKANGEKLMSPPVSIKIAKDEGWFSRKGSKWQTMPDLMLRYRAATYFARTYCPELTMGMQTSEEVHDITEPQAVQAAVVQTEPSDTAKRVHDKIKVRRQRTEPSPAGIKTVDSDQTEEDKRRALLKDQAAALTGGGTVAEGEVEGEPEGTAEAAEPQAGERVPPQSYQRLCRYYDTKAERIDELLAESGLGPLPRIAWQDLDAVGINKINRAAAKLAKEMSEK